MELIKIVSSFVSKTHFHNPLECRFFFVSNTVGTIVKIKQHTAGVETQLGKTHWTDFKFLQAFEQGKQGRKLSCKIGETIVAWINDLSCQKKRSNQMTNCIFSKIVFSTHISSYQTKQQLREKKINFSFNTRLLIFHIF